MSKSTPQNQLLSQRPKTVYSPRIASETFGTSVMKTEEAFIFIQAATDNGVELETAYDDMKMIDALLHVQKIHIVAFPEIKRTKAGHLRKGTSLYDAFEDVINSRLESK